MNDRDDVRSPDAFADAIVVNDDDDDDKSIDSFDAFDVRTLRFAPRARSREPIQCVEDPILTLLDEASDEEAEEANRIVEDGEEDALTRVLRSFRETRQDADVTDAAVSDKSFDVFGEEEMLPVELPNGGGGGSPPTKRRREAEPPTTRPDPNPVEPEYWQMNQKNVFVVNGEAHEINTFGDYMNMKISKLNHQVNQQKSKPFEKLSDIFKGYSVFVNGFTDPPALVIRDLMLAHGGEYHCYYIHGRTSFVIATSIAQAKIDRLREKEIYIRADWITESISARKVLDYHRFLIYEKGCNEKGQMERFLKKPGQTQAPTQTQQIDARNPNFIKEYYSQSRLHLISTLAQDMKDFVAQLKMKEPLRKTEEPEKNDETLVFHIDLDCFFVSVALRNRPELVGAPAAVTHSRGNEQSMSEIASCSYAARECGVRNGMLVKTALQMCPRLVMLPYQFDDYVDVSKRIYEILASFTLDIRAVSCDEMYINATKLCATTNPVQLAETIRATIRNATQCAASVGIGATSLIARLATRHAKPDGVHWVQRDTVREFMANERVGNLPGVGYQMMERLRQIVGGEEMTMRDLQAKSEAELSQVFGPKQAAKIWKQCRGEEPDSPDFWDTQLRKSVSCDINYGIRFSKKEDLTQLMKAISNEIEQKLTQCQMLAGSVTLKLMIRSPNAPIETAKFMGHGHCDTFTKTSNLSCTTLRSDAIYAEAMRLYQRIPQAAELRDLRGVGVTCGKLRCRNRKEAAEAVREMFRNAKQRNVETVAVAEDVPAVTRRRNRRLDGFLDLTQLQIRRFQWRRDAERKKPFKFLEFLKTEPTRDTVTQIAKHFENLLRSGRFNELSAKFREFMASSANLAVSHADWHFASHAIYEKISDESLAFYQTRVAFLEMGQGWEDTYDGRREKKKKKNGMRMVEMHVETSFSTI